MRVILFLCILSLGVATRGTPKLQAATDPEQDLLNSLKQSVTNQDRQRALTRIYNYYKNENTGYLQLNYLMKLIDVLKINNDQRALEMAFLDLGKLYEEKREYLNALSSYFEALSWSAKLKSGRSGYANFHISEVFNVMNRRELAWKYLKKALDYTVEHKDRELKVFVLSSYSQLYYEEANFPEALKFIDLALESESARKKYLCYIRSLYRKALILLKMGEKEGRAMKLLKSAVDKGLREKRYDNLLLVMNRYIEILIRMHRLAEAAKYLDKIDDIYAPYYRYFFVYYYLQAMLYQKQGQPDKALKFYDQTARHMEKSFSKFHVNQYKEFKQITGKIYSRIIEFYLHMYNKTQQQGYIKRALFFSEIKNAYTYEFSALKNKRHVNLLKEKEKMEDEYLACNKQYIQLLEQIRTRSPMGYYNLEKHGSLNKKIVLYEKKLAALKQQNESLNEFILEAPQTYKSYQFNDLDLNIIQAKLKNRRKIIKYTVLEQHIYAFMIEPDSISYYRVPEPTPVVEDKIRQLTVPLDDFTRGNVDYLRINYNLQLAENLYHLLLRDLIEPQLSIDPEELIIIPDNQLFKLPFEALVTGFNRKQLDPAIIFSEYASADYLIQRHPISYALSLFHLQKNSLPPGQRRYDIIAFGDPKINGTAYNQQFFKSLPSSKKEILSIRNIFGKASSRVFLGAGFTRRRFRTFAPQAGILHIATHFINNIDHPQYSALLFSDTGNNEPFYYAHNIFRLKLDADLVVLSACESSEKNLMGMQGLRGMTASFKQAGARSLMVSMWPVDQQSAQITPLFYRKYMLRKRRRRNASPARALQRAKRELMKKNTTMKNGYKISFSHPFLWANYILYNFTPDCHHADGS